MVDVGKREDLILEALSKAITERDLARMEPAEERVAHRLTRKELQEVTGMILRG